MPLIMKYILDFSNLYYVDGSRLYLKESFALIQLFTNNC